MIYFFFAIVWILLSPAHASDTLSGLSVLVDVYEVAPQTMQLKRVRQANLLEPLGRHRPDVEDWFVRPVKNPPAPFTPSEIDSLVAWLRAENVPGVVLDGHTEIGDEDVAQFDRLPQLTLLTLRKTSISNTGLTTLKHLRNLQVFDVGETKVTDEALSRWKNGRKLISEPAAWTSMWDPVHKPEAASPLSFFLGASPEQGIPGFLPRGKYPMDYSLRLKTLDGKVVNLAHKKGKVIFLNFWATWCGPCRGELPSLENLYVTLKDQNAFFAYVTSESPAYVKAFLAKNPRNLPIYIAKESDIAAYKAHGIPATIIVSKKGDWVVQRLGSDKWDTQEIIEYIFKLMNE